MIRWVETASGAGFYISVVLINCTTFPKGVFVKFYAYSMGTVANRGDRFYL